MPADSQASTNAARSVVGHRPSHTVSTCARCNAAITSSTQRAREADRLVGLATEPGLPILGRRGTAPS
jgi:hypothetical protein